MSELRIREQDGAITFEVRVTPRASRNRVIGIQDGALRVALTAPPVDGAANEALTKLLAKALGQQGSFRFPLSTPELRFPAGMLHPGEPEQNPGGSVYEPGH